MRPELKILFRLKDLRIPVVLITASLIIALNNACVEPYDFEEEIEFTPELVVDAFISNLSDNQEITLSMSTSATGSTFDPIDNYAVTIYDNAGNEYPFTAQYGNSGKYTGIIPTTAFVEGSQFQLSIQTDEGKEYYSDMVAYTPCPNVGNIYFEQQQLATTEAGEYTYGVQFYTDFDGSNFDGNYYLFKLEETWEYHSTWPIAKYYDEDNVYHDTLPDYTYYTCYSQADISDIFLLSTNGLSENKYKGFELNFTSDETQRLMNKYSLLVKQYAISYAEYQFWYNIMKNNQESGGLFDNQPSTVPGNICNINDDSETVLGFFGVRGCKTKRVLLNGITTFPYDDVHFCTALYPSNGYPTYRPLYLADGVDESGNTYLGYATDECFICTLKGGTTTMPAYMDIDSLLISK